MVLSGGCPSCIKSHGVEASLEMAGSSTEMARRKMLGPAHQEYLFNSLQVQSQPFLKLWGNKGIQEWRMYLFHTQGLDSGRVGYLPCYLS